MYSFLHILYIIFIRTHIVCVCVYIYIFFYNQNIRHLRANSFQIKKDSIKSILALLKNKNYFCFYFLLKFFSLTLISYSYDPTE